jgi:23S rRNA-/tRNA-specific pseudouridylate synthase
MRYLLRWNTQALVLPLASAAWTGYFTASCRRTIFYIKSGPFVDTSVLTAPVVAAASTTSSESISDEPFVFSGTVDILDRSEHHIVVSKPPGVVCHHSDWTGSRIKSKKKRGLAPEIPMLQRVREAVGERVNLVHRLDRGASGCLLFTFAKSDEGDGNATAILQQAMASSTSTKTYLALVRGEGILKGRDFRKEGWFEVTRPLKDESGNLKNATSYFRFIAGQDNENGKLTDRPRSSLVLARIETGRWHQIRKHLNGLSHPIIGDSSHGNSKTNREWREKWGLQAERTCLHLLQLNISSTPLIPSGISVTSTVAPDMMKLLTENFLPDVLREAEDILRAEGLSLQSDEEIVSVPITTTVN